MFTHNYDLLPPDYKRYSEIELKNNFYLVKKSCNKCQGTGIVGKWCDPRTAMVDAKTMKTEYKKKIPILCRCLIKAIEEKQEEKDKKWRDC